MPGRIDSAESTSTAAISVVCTAIATGGSYTLSLGPSIAGGSTDPRYMSNPAGGADMLFNIFTDPGYTAVWGESGSGSTLGGAIPVGDSNQSLTVYGRVPGGQTHLRAGGFSATLTMTLTYNP